RRLGFGVAVDVGHHDRRVLADCARRLDGLPAWLVGVRCPLEVIMERRRASGMVPEGALEDGVPAPVRLWQERVHVPGVYDLEVDTEAISAVECVEAIEAMVAEGRPEAFRRLAE